MAAYAELQVATNFSFLRGASHAEELVQTAKDQGLAAIGVTDRNSLAGIVRMHSAALEAELPLVVGCRLDLRDGISLLCYPEDRIAYGRLCRLLTAGQMRAKKGACDLGLDDVAGAAEGQVLVVLPPAGSADAAFEDQLRRIIEALPDRPYLAAHHLYRGDDRRRLAMLADVAARYRTPLVATNDIHYHAPARRPLQDVMTCIREGCTLQEAGFRLHAHAERHLKPPVEMARLFRDYEEAIERTIDIAERCRFSLSELRYDYPDEPVPAGKTPQSHLEDLTWQGAAARYPDGVPDKVRALLTKELALIDELRYAPYFLTVHDIVAFAKGEGILCQGRGSAANSAVCYCLRITSVDPAKVDLLVERFINMERKEPPDIDVDFEHERREEVIQYVYRRYGRERAGLCATVIHYRPRSAIREVGKVMGLSEDVTSALAKTVWGSWGKEVDDDQVGEAGFDRRDPKLRQVLALTEQMIGMPRHLSQHVGGFVLTQRPLIETVPVGNAAMPERSFIEWDKDDIDALGILKVDVLALGMLTCIRKCFDLIAAHYGKRYTLATVPKEDPAVYDMLCEGDSIGVFQVESRAQMNMLPRLRPREFYDLVIEVAIVRPGPIQGDMVHPYLRRRSGKEQVDYPSPSPEHGPHDELKRILNRTLGVPIFQEQAMKIAIDAAKFSAVEANQLRKAMATFRSRGMVDAHQDKMVGRMIERGYDENFARRCFDQIKGFGEYGFPESHAASFALLVYISSWIKCRYPAVFACGLLNSQPMGFYAPAQIVRDAREHGVEVRPPDVNYSLWDNTLEPTAHEGRGAATVYALRLGLRQVDGLAEAQVEKLLATRDRPYARIDELRTRSGMSVPAIQKMAEADAFRSTGLDRRQALWEARALKPAPELPLFTYTEISDQGAEPQSELPEMPLAEHVVADYQTMRLSLKAHPMAFLREDLGKEGYVRAVDLAQQPNGRRVSMAGIVLIRQRPGSAKGVCFITIEDETGVANVVVWPDTLQRYRPIIMGARLLAVRGVVQKDSESSVIHVVAQHLDDRSADLAKLSEDRLDSDLARADHVRNPLPAQVGRHPRNVRIIPKSRDFH